MKRFLEIIALIAGSICALIFMAFLAAGLWTKIYGKIWLEHQLDQRFHIKASIGSMGSNFFNSLRAQNVTVTEPIAVSIRSIGLSFQPWELLNPKLAYRNVFFLDVDGLGVSLGDISNLGPNSNSTSKSPKINGPKFPLTVLLSNSSIDLTYQDKPYSLTGVAAEMKASHDGFNTVFVSEAGTVGPVKGRLGYVFHSKKMETVLSFDNLSTDVIEPFIPEKVTTTVGRFDGLSQVHVAFRNQNQWDLKIKTKSMVWRPASASSDHNLQADVAITPDLIDIRQAKLDNNLIFDGQVKNYLSTAEINLNVKAQNASIGNLTALVSDEGQIPNWGNFDGEGKINGPINNLKISADLQARPMVGSAQLPPLQGHLSYENQQASLQAQFADGNINGTWTRSENAQSASLQIKNLRLGSIAEMNKWRTVGGTVDTQLKLTWGPGNKIQIKGPFELDNFSWGRMKPAGVVKGTLDGDGKHFTLATGDDSVLVDVVHSKNEINLTTFKLAFGQESSLTAQGTLKTNTGQVNGTLSGKNIPPDVWPPLVERYPDIKGGLDFEGTLFGQQKTLQANLNLIFHDLKFVSDGEPWNGSGLVVMSPPLVSLKNIHIDGGYSGEVSVKNENDQNEIGLNVTLEQARPQLFRDILKSSAAVTGVLDGFVNVTIKEGYASGQSSVSWQNGSYGSMSFDYAAAIVELNRSKINVSDLSFSWNNQTLRGFGSLSPQDSGDWSYETHLQAQQVGPPSVKLDGEVLATGQFSIPRQTIRGTLKSSALWLNGNPVGDFKISFDRTGQWVTLQGLAAPYFDFDGRWSTQTGRLKGKITGQSLKLEDLVASYLPSMDPKDSPTGLANLQVTVSGTTADPRVKLVVKIPKAEFRSEQFSGEAFIDINRSTVTISSSETRFVNGGVVYAAGTWGLTAEKIANLEGAASNLSLTTLAHLADLPLDWKGQVNSKFSMKGGMTDRQMVITLEGHHEGFRPFSGGGGLVGTAVLKKGELNLDGLTVEAGNGYLKLLPGSKIYLNRDSSGLMRLIGDTRNLRAGPLSFFGGLELSGSWQAPPVGGERPPFEMDVFARSLWVNQLLLSGNVTHLTIGKQKLDFSPVINSEQKISGSLDYTNIHALKLVDFRFLEKGIERFYFDGEIGEENWDFSVRAKGLEATLVRGLFDTTLDMSGPMDLALKGKGSLKNPYLSGAVQWKDGNIAGVPVDEAHCDLLLKDGIVTLTKLAATKKKGFQLSGNLSFGTEFQNKEQPDRPQFDLKIENGDMALLKEMWPDVRKSKGSFHGSVRMKHDLEGDLEISDVSLQTDSYIPVLKNGTLVLNLKNDRLDIKDGHAKLNKGNVQLTGSVLFEDGLPSAYDLKFNTTSDQGALIRIPELTIPPGAVFGKISLLKKKLGGVSQGEFLINLSLKGPAASPTLAGTVKMEKTVFTYPPPHDKKSSGSTVASRAGKNFVNKLVWDVRLEAGERTRFENELVSVPVTGWIEFKGPTSDLGVNGRIDSNSGSIVYSGSEFKLNSAQMEILTQGPSLTTDQKETLVYLKAEAERQVYYSDALGNGNEDTIVMEVDRSLLGEIKPRFYSKSNPNISPEKALKLALGLEVTTNETAGTTTKSGGQTQAEIDRALRVGLVQLLDSNLATPLARSLARETGLVDYIRVTYRSDDSGTDNSSDLYETQTSNQATQNEVLRYVKGTKVKLGREISNRLFADYSFKVDEYQNQVDLKHEVELAYRVHKNLFIRASSELDTERTLGHPPDRRAILENQWRFGLPRKKGSPQAAVPSPTPPSGAPATGTPRKQIK